MSTNAHRLIAVLLLIMVIAAGQWLFERFWLGQRAHYAEATEQLQDRLARYRNLIQQRPLLEQQLGEVKDDATVDAYYLNQETSTLAATELQRRAGQAVQNNGGSLASSQILPIEVDNGFTKVAIRVQMNGDMDALNKALHALESAQPKVFIDNVQLRSRTIRQRVPSNTNQQGRRAGIEIKTQIQLTAQFELAGYMQKRNN